MPYTKTNWQSGDIISSERLNHAEEGIAQAQQTADAVNARDSLADLTDVKITGTPSTGSLLRFGYTPDGDKWQPYTLPNYMDQWQWINESSPNENRLQYNANIIYSWLGNSNGHMYRVKIGKRIIAMTDYYADLVNNIYEFRFGDVVYRATAGNEKPVIVEDGISAISDVDITTPTDGQVILYDATNSKWVNGNAEGGAEYVNVYDSASTSSNIKLTVNLAQILELINNGKIPYMDVQTSVTYSESEIPVITIPIGKYFLTKIEKYSSTYVVMFGSYHFVGTSHDAVPKMNMMFNTLKRLEDYQQTIALATGDVLTYDNTNKKWSGAHPTVSFLKDTTITSPTEGQVLTYDATNNVWINATSNTGVNNLSDLSDVALGDNVSTGQFLRYNNTSGKWQNQTFTAMDTYTYVNSGDNSLLYSSDALWVSFIQYGRPIAINTTTLGFIPLTKAINDNNTTYTFIFGDRVYSGSRYTTPTFVKEGLSALKGINITSPTDGQVLTYDATNSEWVNDDVSGSVEYVNVYGTDGALTKNFDEIVALIESGKIPYIEVTTEYTKAKHDHSPAFTLQKGKHYLAGINIVGSTSYRRVFFSNYMFESSGATSTLTFKQPINSIDGLIGVTWGTSTSNGSVLTYSSALNQWSPKANTIDNLTNVTISSASSGDVLQYDGTKWVNATPSSSGDAPTVLILYDYTDTEGTYGTANTTYLYADDYGIITYSTLFAAFSSGQQIVFQKLATGSNYYSTNMSLKESNGTAYFQVDNIVYAAVEENDGNFIKQNTRTEFYYKMEGRTLTGPRAPEVIQAVELGLDVKLYCDFSNANNTSTTQQFLKIKKLKLEFSYKCYNETNQCYDYIFQAYDHVPIEYTDPTKQMSFSILYHDNSEYGSYYGASF